MSGAASVPAPEAAAAPAPAKPKKLTEQYPSWKVARPFVLGGTSGCFATLCIQPIDMVKVRIQLQGEGVKGAKINKNPLSVGMLIYRNEGFSALYRGLSAALLRQITYGTTRLGLFRTFTTTYSDKDGKMSIEKRALAAVVAGGTGALVGTPADAALIRMQADQTLPVDQRRNYRNVVDALVRTAREDGLVRGVFAGASPTIIRAISLNLGMLGTYDITKESLQPHFKDSTFIPVLGAGMVSGLAASVFSLPFDFVKTRLQKQKKLPDGTYPYRGFVHCFGKVVATEGPLSLYNGFATYYIRIAPHIVITWATLEYLNSVIALK